MFDKSYKALFVGAITLIASCQSGNNNNSGSGDVPAGFHKVVVEEVLQASQYTYLRTKENSNEKWLAVPSMQAKTGETYYYEGGLVMTNFESKDLHKNFESVVFVDGVSKEPKKVVAEKNNSTGDGGNPHGMGGANDMPSGTGEDYKRTSAAPEKLNVKIAQVQGGISIGELFAKKKEYAGKIVKIKGQVTKYTPAVLQKNWIHIQDGTNFKESFDLTVTSSAEVKVGDVVTLEGKVSLDKDLGYGYFFDVLMEEAVIK